MASASILLVGLQGAGKGTMGRLLSHHPEIAHISAGALLRGHCRDGGQWSEEIEMRIDRGEHVPEHISYGLLGEALKAVDAEERVVLDGYPREGAQVPRLLGLLESSPELVVNLQVPRPIAVDRLLARQTCRSCDGTFGPGAPPRAAGVCDECGDELARRKDDEAPAIARRLDGWASRGPEVLNELGRVARRVDVDASRSLDEVLDEVVEAVDGLRN